MPGEARKGLFTGGSVFKLDVVWIRKFSQNSYRRVFLFEKVAIRQSTHIPATSQAVAADMR